MIWNASDQWRRLISHVSMGETICRVQTCYTMVLYSYLFAVGRVAVQ